MLAGCTTYFSIKTSQKFYLKCVFMHFIWFSGQTAIIPPHSINRFLFVIVTWYFCEVGTVYGCRDRLVEIATSYGPNGPGMESRWVGGRRVFPSRPDRIRGPPNLLYSEYQTFPWGTAAGASWWPPTPFQCRVAILLEQYLHLASVTAQTCHGVTFRKWLFTYLGIFRAPKG